MRILKIKSLPSAKEWIDRDIMILHACFQLLEDYVILEDGCNHCSYEAHAESVDEVMFLHNWWQTRKLEIYQMDDNEDDEMLLRLMKVRRFLWT
jgi:hypothetical protein